MRDGLQHGPSLRNFLSSEEREPDTGESDHSDTNANDKQQQNGWAWFGLTSFHWCFDNDAVLLDHDCDLNLRCEIGAVKYRDSLNIVWRGTGWCVFRSVAQRFGGCIQAVHCFVRAATGVVRAGWHLFARISFQVGCVCGHKISFR
jgi:hypothetical protein